MSREATVICQYRELIAGSNKIEAKLSIRVSIYLRLMI
jgi:hypothetical protein